MDNNKNQTLTPTEKYELVRHEIMAIMLISPELLRARDGITDLLKGRADYYEVVSALQGLVEDEYLTSDNGRVYGLTATGVAYDMSNYSAFSLSKNMKKPVAKPAKVKKVAIPSVAAMFELIDDTPTKEPVVSISKPVEISAEGTAKERTLVTNNKHKAVAVVVEKPVENKLETNECRQAFTVNDAIVQLEARLKSKPIVIDDLKMKLGTLESLALILDPSIAVVLTAVANDLKDVMTHSLDKIS